MVSQVRGLSEDLIAANERTREPNVSVPYLLRNAFGVQYRHSSHFILFLLLPVKVEYFYSDGRPCSMEEGLLNEGTLSQAIFSKREVMTLLQEGEEIFSTGKVSIIFHNSSSIDIEKECGTDCMEWDIEVSHNLRSDGAVIQDF